MPYELSSGLIIAGAYASKVRRTMFAQAKSLGVPSDEVVRSTAELNMVLYEILVNRLRLNKGDVVRVRIDYEVENGRIRWLYDTLRVEAFRRISDEEVRRGVRDVVAKVDEVIKGLSARAPPLTLSEAEEQEE